MTATPTRTATQIAASSAGLKPDLGPCHKWRLARNAAYASGIATTGANHQTG
jgi:hypothetical protein